MPLVRKGRQAFALSKLASFTLPKAQILEGSKHKANMKVEECSSYSLSPDDPKMEMSHREGTLPARRFIFYQRM